MPTAAPQGEVENDGQLLGRFLKARDDAPFAELMRRHGGMVMGVCQRMLGGSHDAEDAAQAVFLMLAQKAAGLRGRASAAGWLHQAACHVAMHARRAQMVRAKYELEAAQMQQRLNNSGADDLSQRDLGQIRGSLDVALAALPEKYRLPIILHHFEGCSYEDGAVLMQCSVGTFSSRVSRGREMLRQELQRAEGAAPGATGKRAEDRSSLLALSGAALASQLSRISQASAAMPSALVAATAKAAAMSLAGGAGAVGAAVGAGASGLVSAKAAALMHGGLAALRLAQLKLAAVAATVFLVLSAAGLSAYAIIARSGGAPINPGQTAPMVDVHPPHAAQNDNGRIDVRVKAPADQQTREEPDGRGK